VLGEKVLHLPEGKKFAFTIIDDTDDSTVDNTKPIYDFLFECGLRTTKTVWVYPPRDRESSGDCLLDERYRSFIQAIKTKGFEIALHNVGSGEYRREEILRGLEDFRRWLGEYPRIHINHAYNPDSIYGGYKRFDFPFDKIIRLLHPVYADNYQGEVPGSEYFWGDVHKKIIRYSRNYETDRLNTLAFNPYMPYLDSDKTLYSNYWFSSTFAPNQWMFNRIVTPHRIDQLEKQGGVCILNTHLGYYMRDGGIDRGFVDRIRYLSSKKTGWFVPDTPLLNHLRKCGAKAGRTLPWMAKYRFQMSYLVTRFKYRKIIKIDDYAFKREESSLSAT